MEKELMNEIESLKSEIEGLNSKVDDLNNINERFKDKLLETTMELTVAYKQIIIMNQDK